MPRKPLHRLRHALAGLLTPQPAPQPSRSQDLEALIPLLDRAVLLQPDAERVIGECAAPGRAAEDLAPRGNAVAVGYWQLRRDLMRLPVSPSTHPLKDELRRLFLYHEWSVHEAVDCACSPQQTAKMTEARAQMHGLGAPGVRLRDLRHHLKAEFAALRGQDGHDPGDVNEENPDARR